ncbi:MAG: hypothetical protein KGJ09_10330 [Candidatus Omnitrophica bacterium]|nr:hypothetical protein [Candidatus Omnitrophota bacterium]MDE2215474.1 hypothetical protein [Candidatus Omnitrophota bacterium]
MLTPNAPESEAWKFLAECNWDDSVEKGRIYLYELWDSIRALPIEDSTKKNMQARLKKYRKENGIKIPYFPTNVARADLCRFFAVEAEREERGAM